LRYIRSKDVKSGIAINPDTEIDGLIKHLDSIDYILIMSVFPGFGGQSFIKGTLDKMKTLSQICKNRSILIGVDGGVNLSTIDEVYNHGADVTIVGSGLFKADNIKKRYDELMCE
jgi:ribulose-phosphate 3-epimerase